MNDIAHSGARAAARGIGAAMASLLLAVYLLAVTNWSFWRALWLAVAPQSAADFALLGAIGAMLLALFWSLLSLLGWKRIARPAWIAVSVLAASAAYFMDTYGLLLDRVAIQSVFETDPREASEWISLRMLPYLVLALIPSLLLLRVRLRLGSWKRELAIKAGIVVLAIAALGAGLALGFQPLSSLARNHRELAHLLNPTAVIQSTYGYARRVIAPRSGVRVAVGADAHPGASWQAGPRPRVLVLVVGESARARSFGVLGYARDTTPRLSHSEAIAFGDVESCGTSTAVSLPCMFSDLGQAHYSDGKARARENLLDVLIHAGVHPLWVDNNTGSKGIAWQADEHFLAEAADARRCNAAGCFDEILVDALRESLDTGKPPALIVLHQKGSHGPSYFERYPAPFRRFTPTCESNELENCSREEIVNTYDNTILYTDHVLGEIIGVLREHQDQVDGAMLYVADHGESTGEHGMFLHGAPSFMAPAEQTHVPMIAWLSDGYAARAAIDRGCLAAHRDRALSHDNLFHSVLSLLDVTTAARNDDLDVFARCRLSAGGSQLARARSVQ